VGSERLELKYRNRVVVADATECPWKIRDVDDQDVDWRVLVCAPDLEPLPVVLVEEEDVNLFAEGREIPPSLRSALHDALAGQERSSVANQEQDIDQEEEEQNTRLIERYLAMAEEDPRLKDHPVAWFHIARELCLFGSLTLYDTQRPPDGDPLPVGNGIPNWDLQRYKTQGWVARAFMQAGVSTLYETTAAYRYSGAQQGRRLVLSGVTAQITPLANYIPWQLRTFEGLPAPPQATPFVVHAAETKA
jgi:hypothetical protein